VEVLTLRRVIIVSAALLLLFVSGCTDKYKTKEELFKEGVKVLDANNPSGAIIAFKKALEKDQNFFEARLQLAKAYRDVGKLDSAENELQKVVRQNPSSVDVHVELGRIALLKDRPDDALKEVSGFISDENASADAMEVAGWAYAMKGDYPRSVELLKKILPDRKLGAKAELTLSRVYAKMGRLDEAYAQIQDLTGKDPANMEALVVLGDVQTKRRDIDAAIKTYDKVTEMDPRNIEIAARKTLLLIAKGAYDQALSDSESIVITRKTSWRRRRSWRSRSPSRQYPRPITSLGLPITRKASPNRR
jgi:tetratricopeptide (TPR) repeat protein